MFKNLLIDAKRQNRSALLCAATLVAIGAAGCAEPGAEDADGELAQEGPSVGEVSRQVDPGSVGGPGVISVTREPVVPGGPAVTGSNGVGTVTRKPIAGLSGPYFADVTANGTGCPAGTWNAAISPDGQTFTATFNSYSAFVSPESAISIKDCQLAIKLQSPEQLSYSVQSFRFSGFAYLEKGVSASQTATFYIQGNPGNSIEARSDLNGPFNAGYTLNTDVELGKKLWSPCSAERTLNVQTRLRVRNGDPRGTGYVNLAAVSGSAKLVARISWRRCNDSDELGTPIEDDGDWSTSGPTVIGTDRDSTPEPTKPTGGPVVIDTDRDATPEPTKPTGGPVVIDTDRDSTPEPTQPTGGPVVIDTDRDASPTPNATPGTPAVIDSDRDATPTPVAPTTGPAIVGTGRTSL